MSTLQALLAVSGLLAALASVALYLRHLGARDERRKLEVEATRARIAREKADADRAAELAAAEVAQREVFLRRREAGATREAEQALWARAKEKKR